MFGSNAGSHCHNLARTVKKLCGEHLSINHSEKQEWLWFLSGHVASFGAVVILQKTQNNQNVEQLEQNLWGGCFTGCLRLEKPSALKGCNHLANVRPVFKCVQWCVSPFSANSGSFPLRLSRALQVYYAPPQACSICLLTPLVWNTHTYMDTR